MKASKVSEPMRVLLLGAQGQLGWELRRAFAPLARVQACARPKENMACGSVSLDVTDVQALRQAVEVFRPHVILNAAAYTGVDSAERDVKQAEAVNALAPAVMADLARKYEAWLVHFSTDYVFDGTGQHARTERDLTQPLNVYGKTKLAGELAVQSSGCQYLLFRTSWVYAARGHNFLRTIVSAARKRESLSVVSDQVGAPTGVELIADTVAHAVRAVRQQSAGGGAYHLTAQGQVSWYEYAHWVLSWLYQRGYGQQLKTQLHNLVPVSTAEYAASNTALAPRPMNSRLSTRKLCDTFDLLMPDWTEGVERVLEQWLRHDACSS